MCEQCEGPNANSCLSCKTPMLLNSKQCSCPDGMYQEGTICKNCHDDCTTCSGPLPSQCIKCNTKSDGLLKEYLKLATNKGNLGLSTIIREEDNVPLNGDSIVDVVLTFDTTGSMETYIAQMGAVLDKINSELVKKFVGKKLDIHYGIVAYRNHPNKDDVYLTYSHDLSDLRSIKEFLPKLKVSGGNDYEEAVVDALWIIAK